MFPLSFRVLRSRVCHNCNSQRLCFGSKFSRSSTRCQSNPGWLQMNCCAIHLSSSATSPCELSGGVWRALQAGGRRWGLCVYTWGACAAAR
eukprot:scaffold49150_cov71-Phaeocystis_antarctica.AAC.3